MVDGINKYYYPLLFETAREVGPNGVLVSDQTQDSPPSSRIKVTVLNLARPFSGKKKAMEGAAKRIRSRHIPASVYEMWVKDWMAVVRSVALVGQRRKVIKRTFFGRGNITNRGSRT